MKRHSAAEGINQQRRIASSDTRHAIQNQTRAQVGAQYGQSHSNARLQPKESVEKSRLNRSIGFNNKGTIRNLNDFKQDVLSVGDANSNEIQPPITAQMKQSTLSMNVNFQPPMLPHKQPGNQSRKPGQQRESSYQARLSNAGQAYQSSLLTRFIKQPSMPSSRDVHQALSYERAAGWPSVHQQNMNSANKGNPRPIKEARASNANSSGIPRHPRAKKSTLREKPHQAHLNGGKGHGEPMPINYQNQAEIMRKIFGNDQRYSMMKGFAKRQSSESMFAISNPSQTAYSAATQQKQQRLMLGKKQAVSPSKKYIKQQSDDQVELRTAARAVSTDPRESYMNANAKKCFQNQNALVSPQRRKDTDPKRYNQSGSDRHKTPASASAGLALERGPTGTDDQKAEDSAERAFLDLQDAKVNFFQEKMDHDTKMQQRRTFTNGFSINQTQTTSTSETAAANPASVFQVGTPTRQQPSGTQTMTSGFNFKKEASSTAYGFGDKAQLMSDDRDLKSDLNDLTKEDLRERLFVAERVMKSLFQRNREIEVANEQLREQATETSTDPVLKPALESVSNCFNCHELQVEVDQGKEKETELAKKVEDLERQLQEATKGKEKEDGGSHSYKEFMLMRLEVSQAESKRHFENYIKIRNQLNSMLEQQQLHHGTPASKDSTPKGGVKGSRLKQDLVAHVTQATLQEQELVLQQEEKSYQQAIQRIEEKILQKDSRMSKMQQKVKEMTEEIERRKFLESKVQTYVRGLIDQNEKCKQFISIVAADADPTSGSRATPRKTTDNEHHWRLQAKKLQQQLDVNQYDENDGQSTENEPDNEEDESMDDVTETEQTPAKTETSKLASSEPQTPNVESEYGLVPKEEQSADQLIESQDVAVSDI